MIIRFTTLQKDLPVYINSEKILFYTRGCCHNGTFLVFGFTDIENKSDVCSPSEDWCHRGIDIREPPEEVTAILDKVEH